MFVGTHTQQRTIHICNNLWGIYCWIIFERCLSIDGTESLESPRMYITILLVCCVVVSYWRVYQNNMMQQPWKLWFDGYIRIYNSWDRFRHSWIYRTNQPTKLLQYYLVLTNLYKPRLPWLKLNCKGMQQHSRLTIISHEKCRRGAEYTALSYPI